MLPDTPFACTFGSKCELYPFLQFQSTQPGYFNGAGKLAKKLKWERGQISRVRVLHLVMIEAGPVYKVVVIVVASPFVFFSLQYQKSLCKSWQNLGGLIYEQWSSRNYSTGCF